MKNRIIATILVFLLFITSCSHTGEFSKEELEQVVCTADVQECPDGSFVGRDPLNNCEFKECP